MTAGRAQEIRTGLAQLHAADPVLAQVIDEHPGFDPDTWIQRLPAMDLFGALVFQVIGQQISVIAATAIFARLAERFEGRVPNADELAAVDEGMLRGIGLSRRKAATVLDLAQRFADGRLSDWPMSRSIAPSGCRGWPSRASGRMRWPTGRSPTRRAAWMTWARCGH
jgi:3-methyladenine DNA glycosylase/8-oxoguanine DNA glycosylase